MNKTVNGCGKLCPFSGDDLKFHLVVRLVSSLSLEPGHTANDDTGGGNSCKEASLGGGKHLVLSHRYLLRIHLRLRNLSFPPLSFLKY